MSYFPIDAGDKKNKEINKENNGTMILDASDTAKWAKWYGYADGMSTNKVNTKYAKTGITASSDGTATAIRNNTVRKFNLVGRKFVTVFIYVENAKSVGTISFYFSNATNYGSYRAYEFGGNKMVEGWNEVKIDLSAPTETKGLDTDNLITSVQILLNSVVGQITKVTLDSMFVGKPEKKPAVLFTFDDAWMSQYNLAFPMMLEKGFKGSIGVVANWSTTGTADVPNDIMTLPHLEEVYRHGWDLFNHTTSHTNLTTKTAEEVVSEIIGCKNWLNERGFTRASDILAYPYGGHNEDVVNALKPHLKYARTLVEGREPSFPLEVLKGKTRNVVIHSAVTVNAMIDDAIKNNETLVLCLHKIGATVDAYNTTYLTAQFKLVLDYLYSKKDLIDVKTISEWVNENI